MIHTLIGRALLPRLRTTLALLLIASGATAQSKPKRAAAPTRCPAGQVADTAGLGARIAADASLEGFRTSGRCVVSADLDQDGKQDRAAVLVSRTAGKRYAIFPGRGGVIPSEKTGRIYGRPSERPFVVVEWDEAEVSACPVIGYGPRYVPEEAGGRFAEAGWGAIAPDCGPSDIRPRPVPVDVAAALNAAQSAPTWRDPQVETALGCKGLSSGLRVAPMFRSVFKDYKVSEQCVWIAELTGDGKPDYLAIGQTIPGPGEYSSLAYLLVITSTGHRDSYMVGSHDMLTSPPGINSRLTPIAECGRVPTDSVVFEHEVNGRRAVTWRRGRGLVDGCE
jgi:hypothetical protein